MIPKNAALQLQAPLDCFTVCDNKQTQFEVKYLRYTSFTYFLHSSTWASCAVSALIQLSAWSGIVGVVGRYRCFFCATPSPIAFSFSFL